MVKILTPLILVLLLAGCGARARPSQPPSCCAPAAAASPRVISATRAYGMMSGSSDFVLLDVRSEREFRERRIEGALSLPAGEVRSRAGGLIPDKNAAILVYCRTGRRSAAAARELVRMGYANVYDFGGIVDWPYETVGD